MISTANFPTKERAIRQKMSGAHKPKTNAVLSGQDELPASTSRTAERLRRSVIAPKDKPVNSVGRGLAPAVRPAHTCDKTAKLRENPR